MSRGKRESAETAEGRAVGAFLRSLAARAEADAGLAAQIAAALCEGGLLPVSERTSPRGARSEKSRGHEPRAGASEAEASTLMPPDPFVVFRERGEAGLRTTLDGLDLAALRQIVRAHRLDPARISARWTARERVVSLIVDQVRARANHGKAFARV